MSSECNAIAVITARGGSKRIPRKNIKYFCGKPIIEYSIRAALDSGIFCEVMVSTDDNEIVDIARKAGASVPFMRSEQTSNDYAVTADVLMEVLDCYKEMGRQFDIACCIYPTAPFVTAEKLRMAYRKLQESGADALIPMVKYGFPPQRAFIVEDGYAVYQYPQYALTRSQDLEPVYHDCGQFYFCRTEAFFVSRSLVAGKTIPFVIPENEVQDIDTELDWRLAELKYINNQFDERTSEKIMKKLLNMSGGGYKYRHLRLFFWKEILCHAPQTGYSFVMSTAGKAVA